MAPAAPIPSTMPEAEAEASFPPKSMTMAPDISEYGP